MDDGGEACANNAAAGHPASFSSSRLIRARVRTCRVLAQPVVVVLDELMLHGWDLASATGQNFAATDQDLAICTDFAAAMSTPETLQSREGIYGSVVQSDADAGRSPRPGRTPPQLEVA